MVSVEGVTCFFEISFNNIRISKAKWYRKQWICQCTFKAIGLSCFVDNINSFLIITPFALMTLMVSSFLTITSLVWNIGTFLGRMTSLKDISVDKIRFIQNSSDWLLPVCQIFKIFSRYLLLQPHDSKWKAYLYLMPHQTD